MWRNVLLVDDDADIILLVTTFLKPAGYITRSVINGYKAIEELQKNHYDLVILDISMPELDGFHVLRAIRGTKKFESLPVIMLTASHDPGDLEKVKGEVNDYVIKPPDRKDLLTRVEKLMSRRPQLEEINFTAENIAGTFEIPVRLISISNSGIVLHSPIPAEKGFILHSLQFELFKDLRLMGWKFQVSDANILPDGSFEYFVSFLGLSKGQQERIQQWIERQALQRKRGFSTVSRSGP